LGPVIEMYKNLALKVTLIKFKLAILSLALCSCLFAQIPASIAFKVFGATVSLDEDCSLAVSEQSSIELPLSANGSCRFVTHANTSIIHTHFINGAYIFFVEYNYDSLEGCISEYTAFGVQRGGIVKTTDMVQKSGSCYQARELKDFEIFSTYL